MRKYLLLIILIILFTGCKTSHLPVFEPNEVLYTGEIFWIADILPAWSGFVIACEIDHLSVDGSRDILLYYINTKGKVIWEKIIGNDGFEGAHCLSTAGENVALAGFCSPEGSNTRDALIILFDRRGEILWLFKVDMEGNTQYLCFFPLRQAAIYHWHNFCKNNKNYANDSIIKFDEPQFNNA
jgi:hypothetical protein